MHVTPQTDDGRVTKVETGPGKALRIDVDFPVSPEFLDQVEKRFNERGLKTKRFGKPTNAKVATPENLQKVASEVDLVLIGLSD